MGRSAAPRTDDRRLAGHGEGAKAHFYAENLARLFASA
jgi:hypothetical protein